MLSALDVVTSVGPSTFEVLVPGERREVGDVFLAEPGGAPVGRRGDLVLGAGCPPEEAADLVRGCAAAGASGLVLRSTAAKPAVGAARDERLLLAAVQPDVSWAHLVWVLRGVIDRAAAPDAPATGDAEVHQDLFAVADAVAAIVDAPVTIEDNRSRVLAYSSGQASTDPARVSTIVGRRVPPEVLAALRARGVFRRLAHAREPFLVPAAPGMTLPRLVVPVRAGDEWLGSVWAAVRGPVPERVAAELTSAASVLALHLLRLRAQADVARREAVARLRRALTGAGAGDPRPLRLPEGPWRVVALAAPSPSDDLSQRVDLWATTLRRNGWADPPLADVDGTVHAVTGAGTAPGSWPWLREVVATMHRADRAVAAAAGSPAASLAELPRSRSEAAETLQVVLEQGAAAGAFEESWAALTVARATARLEEARTWGPVGVLQRSDRDRGTAYVATLAAWLAHPGEPTRAAAALHVHPNTLRHRMRRIGELVDVDLDDPTVRLAVRLQVTALRRDQEATG